MYGMLVSSQVISPIPLPPPHTTIFPPGAGGGWWGCVRLGLERNFTWIIDETRWLVLFSCVFASYKKVFLCFVENRGQDQDTSKLVRKDTTFLAGESAKD